MDLLVGESLRQKLDREGRLGHDEVARIAIDVLSALEAAHARGIIHRDLKPDNVFLARSPDGREDVTVLDFGIAKVTTLGENDSEAAALTKTDSMLGTPYYMAPEQVYAKSRAVRGLRDPPERRARRPETAFPPFRAEKARTHDACSVRASRGGPREAAPEKTGTEALAALSPDRAPADRVPARARRARAVRRSACAPGRAAGGRPARTGAGSRAPRTEPARDRAGAIVAGPRPGPGRR
jgi:serine/threonine-protein kinase